MIESEFLQRCEDLWDWNNVPMPTGVKGELSRFYQAIWDDAYYDGQNDGYSNGYDAGYYDGSKENDDE